MSKIINMPAEALEMVNNMLEEEILEEKITLMEVTEEQLQKKAYYYDDSEVQEAKDLYTLAYQLKLHKKELMKLRRMLYGTEGS